MHVDHLLKHFGHLFGWSLMGTSIGVWVADNGMAILSAAGIITSIVIQVLTYRLRVREIRRREVEAAQAKLGAKP